MESGQNGHLSSTKYLLTYHIPNILKVWSPQNMPSANKPPQNEWVIAALTYDIENYEECRFF